MWRNSMNQPLCLQIVLLGKTGAGKSSSGNTIIGGDKEPFKVGFLFDFQTRICQQEQTEVDGQKINVIDTMGLPDPPKKDTETQTKIEQQIFDICARDGVDVFLLVIKLGEKKIDEDKNPVMWIQEIFGAKVLKHTIVLFTHGDQLHEPVENCLREYKTLRSEVDQCSGGYHVFNNKDEDRSQVTELLKKIDTQRVMNGDKYTKQDYERNQKELDERCRNREAAEEKARLLEAATVGGVGALGGGVVGLAIAAKMGAAALTEGETVAGAVGGAFVGAAVGAGLYYFTKKPRKTDKSD